MNTIQARDLKFCAKFANSIYVSLEVLFENFFARKTKKYETLFKGGFDLEKNRCTNIQ